MSTDQWYCYYHLEAGHIRPGHKLQEFKNHVNFQFLTLQRFRPQEQEGLSYQIILTPTVLMHIKVVTWLGSTTSGVIALNLTLLITPERYCALAMSSCLAISSRQ